MLLQFLGFRGHTQDGGKSSLLGYATFLCSAAAISPIRRNDLIPPFLEEWAPRDVIAFDDDQLLVEVAVIVSEPLEVSVQGPNVISRMDVPCKLTDEVQNLMVEYAVNWIHYGVRGCSH